MTAGSLCSALHCQHCVGRNTFNRCLSQAPAALTLQPSLSSDSQCHTRGRLQKDTKKDQHCVTLTHYRYHTLSNTQDQSQCYTRGRLQKDTVLSHYHYHTIKPKRSQPMSHHGQSCRLQADTKALKLLHYESHTQKFVPSVTPETE